MVDRRLERKLQRINDGPRPPRSLLALTCLALLAAATVSPPGAEPLPLTAILALLPGAAWLRRYHAVRPRAGAIVTHLAFGAFVGGCAAGIAIDVPDTAREWLRAPASHGGPPIALVLITALIEDLAADVRGRPFGHG